MVQKFGFLNTHTEMQQSAVLLKDNCFKLSVISLWKDIQVRASAFLWTVAFVVICSRRRSYHSFQVHHHEIKGLKMLRIFIHVKIVTVVSKLFHEI
jgi:hypothetical protein